MKKGILLFLFLISSLYSMGQGFIYSYSDPCTSKINEIYIDNPNGNTALFYGGQTQSFTAAQLQSGAVQQWINQVNSSNPLGPCSGVGLAQNVTVNSTIASNNISVLTSVLSTLSSITSVAATTVTSTVSSVGGASLGGIVQADEKVTDNNNNSGGDDNKDKSNNNTNGTTTTNNNGGNSTTTNGNTGTSQSGGNQNTSSGTGGSTNSQGGTTTTTNNTTTRGEQTSSPSVATPVTSGNQTSSQTTNNQGNTSVPSNSPVTSGNNSTPNTNNSTTPNTNNSTESGGGGGNLAGGANAVKADTNEKNEKQEQAKEEAKSVQSSSAQSSSGTKSKVAAVKQGSVMMTGDIVTIASASAGDPTQVKINSSIIMSNTKNTFAKGALINFTSSVNNSNVTLFMSFRKKKLTTIFANSTMMNFQKDLFNTTSIMESYQYHKITGTAGINLTTGNIGSSKFQSISTLAGLIGTFKVNKNFGMTTMFVMVYSPYVFYYEGMWNQSGYIAVPFVAVDYKLTKKFKLNVSFSGVNQINDKTLNYQVLLGAKAFL